MSGQKRRNSIGRRVLSNGRSAEKIKYTSFHQWMMESEAFKSLNPFAFRVLFELYSLYNGFNNGYLFLSIREAAKRCRMSKDKASACFKQLEEKGFIRRRLDEPENFFAREARCWILNEFDFKNVPASKGFMKWRPEEKN